MSIGKRKYKSSVEKAVSKSVKIVEAEDEEFVQQNEEIEGKKFYQQIIRELEFGDIFVINRCFEQIIANDKFVLTEEVVTKIGVAIFKYADTIFIPIELAEKTLQLLGRFTEVPFLISQLQLIASNQTFILAIIHLFQYFHRKYALQDPSEGSFSSHTCYELALYIFLGIIENPVLLAKLLGRVSSSQFQNLFTALGNIIPVDILYLTQEMALEILARICHVLRNQNLERVKFITQSLNERLRNTLCGSKAEILTVLRDMRPILGDINENNLNVESYRLRGMEIKYKMNEEVSKRAKLDAWLDLCLEKLCIQILRPPSSIRIDYDAIKSVHRDVEKETILTVSFNSGNKKLLGLFSLADSELNSFLLNLVFSNGEDVEAAKSFFDAKLIGIEKVEKLSVVSSKAYPKRIKLSSDGSSLFSKDKVVLGLEISSSEMEETISSITYQDIPESNTTRNRHEIISMKEVNQKVNDPLLDTGIEGSKKIIPKRIKQKPKMKAAFDSTPPSRRRELKGSIESNEPSSGKKRKEPSFVEQPKDASEIDTFPMAEFEQPSLNEVAKVEESEPHSKRLRTLQPSKPSIQPSKKSKKVARGRTPSIPPPEQLPPQKIVDTIQSNLLINISEKENMVNVVAPVGKKKESFGSNNFEVMKSSNQHEDNLPVYESSNVLNYSFYEPLEEMEVEGIQQPKTERNASSLLNDAQITNQGGDMIEERKESQYPESPKLGVNNIELPSFSETSAPRELEELENSLRDLQSFSQVKPPPTPIAAQRVDLTPGIAGLTPLHPLQDRDAPLTPADTAPQTFQRRIDPKKYQQLRFEERDEEEGREDNRTSSDRLPRMTGNGDEEDVFSMLLMEVAAMQKKRMKRKRSRQLSTIAANAETQLLQFIDQWFQYVDSLLYDANDGLAINLQNLLQHHLKPLEVAIKELYSRRTSHERSHESHLNALQNDFQSYLSELQSHHDQKLKEKRQLLIDIEELRKNTVDRVEKELRAQNQRNMSSNDRYKRKELLLRRLESI